MVFSATEPEPLKPSLLKPALLTESLLASMNTSEALNVASGISRETADGNSSSESSNVVDAPCVFLFAGEGAHSSLTSIDSLRMSPSWGDLKVRAGAC